MPPRVHGAGDGNCLEYSPPGTIPFHALWDAMARGHHLLCQLTQDMAQPKPGEPITQWVAEVAKKNRLSKPTELLGALATVLVERFGAAGAIDGDKLRFCGQVGLGLANTLMPLAYDSSTLTPDAQLRAEIERHSKTANPKAAVLLEAPAICSKGLEVVTGIRPVAAVTRARFGRLHCKELLGRLTFGSSRLVARLQECIDAGGPLAGFLTGHLPTQHATDRNLNLARFARLLSLFECPHAPGQLDALPRRT